MLSFFNATENILISIHYDTEGLNFGLCRDANAIVSVQTSLAEESLA